MEGHLANHKAVAGNATKNSSSNWYKTFVHTQTHIIQASTWVERKKMTPLVGACERTSDVALTFRWLLALGLRLLGQLLQLPVLLSLQHWVLILGLPVYMTRSLQNRRWTQWKKKINQDIGGNGREGQHGGENNPEKDKKKEEHRNRVKKRGQGWRQGDEF